VNGPHPTDNPAVTVAIPAYKPQYLSDAIDSVLTQNFKNFEIVVVNDGSPNTSSIESIVRKCPQIHYIYQENAGGAAARNRAANAARAPLIVNLDDDDLLMPSCLESQVSFMQQHPEIDVRYVNSVYFGSTEWEGTCWMDHNPSDGDVSFLSVMEGRTAPANPGAIIRKETLLRVGSYDPVVDSWDDFDLWLRILKAGGHIAYTRSVLVRYRRHAENVSLRGKFFLEQALRVLDKTQSAMELTADELGALERRRANVKYDLEILRGKAALQNRDWKAAQEHFKYCHLDRPTPKLRLLLMILSVSPALLVGAMTVRDQFWRLSGRRKP
jgi:glycosyltransferase involved in cell wall biosynthesis